MSNERRRSRALSKGEDVLDVARNVRNEPASSVLPEARQPPVQLPAVSRRSSRHDVAEAKAFVAASPQTNLRRKSITKGEDALELAKVPPTVPAGSPDAPRQPTSQGLGRSRRGSRYDTIEPATPVAPAAPVKSPAFGIGVTKPLPSKPVSSAHSPRSRRGSTYELQVKTPERQANVQAQNDVIGKKGTAAGDSRMPKGASSYGKESQLYVTASDTPVQNAHRQPMSPGKVVVQGPSYDWESQLDDRQTKATWPCMICAMALLVSIVIFVILLLVESSQKLASLERTTITSPLEPRTTRVLEREMFESVAPLVDDLPGGTKQPATTGVQLSAEDERQDVDALRTFSTTVYGGVVAETETSSKETRRHNS